MAMVMNLSKDEQGESEGFTIEIDIRKETKTVTFKLDASLLQRIDESIKQRNGVSRNSISRSDFIRHAILFKLQKLKA
ncbi:hypothetical protein L3N51_00421 [Metallosphaera sp. J1]|nr:hypothetical protein [Metallosphaera javensis (ex Hofmann et al. 2022)]BCS94007.1 MAG: hypothetical protein MjAS7_2615 [Metallosphaera javensis (ex Sakai et al. 2022)]